MSRKHFSRRQFLQSSGVAAAGVAAVAGGAMIVGPNSAWALSTSTLDVHQAETLLVMARHLFPHDMLGNQYYAKVVDALDQQAAGDAGVKSQLTAGIADLDSAMGIAFVRLSEGNQLKALKQIEGSGFFGAVHGATVNNLYGNPLVYRHFGFEGSSVEHGGYLERGFDDIGWLPKH